MNVGISIKILLAALTVIAMLAFGADDTSSIGIIGGADGPTSIVITATN